MRKSFLFAGIVRLLISGFGALAFCFLSSVAWADSIPVQNASFEIVANPPGLNQACAGTGCAFNDVANGDIPDWTHSFNASAGSFRPGSSTTYFNTVLPDGNIVAYINNGSISQTLGVFLMPDSTYTLSVDVGRRNDAAGVNYSLNLLDGSNVFCSQSGSNSTITAGTFSEVTLTCTTGASVPAGLLGIELTGFGRQVNFDNVQLNVTTTTIPTPEPSTLALTFVSLLVGGLLFVRSRRNQYLQRATS